MARLDFTNISARGQIATTPVPPQQSLGSAHGQGGWRSTMSMAQTHQRQERGLIELEDGGVLKQGSSTLLASISAAIPASCFSKRTLHTTFFDKMIAMVGLNKLYGVAHLASKEFSYALPAEYSRSVAEHQQCHVARGPHIVIHDQHLALLLRDLWNRCISGCCSTLMVSIENER